METSSFHTYTLTAPDTLSAACLNQLQKCFIQNQVAGVAEQIINLEYDPISPQKFAQQDAYLKGQMAAFRYLLLCSEESEAQLRISAQEAAYNSFPQPNQNFQE